jgi:hypothetical protein
VWTDRESNDLGAVVFLTPEEVAKARENGEIKIELQGLVETLADKHD